MPMFSSTGQRQRRGFLSRNASWVALLGGAAAAAAPALLMPGEAAAQSCSRDCPPAERDARGCCKPRPAPGPGPSRPPPGPPPGPPPAPTCPVGQEINQDTAGRCCWPGQAWASSGCVGRPTSCPEGFEANNTRCEQLACAPGRVRTADGVNCCWPGQGFRSSDRTCVGTPTCPRGFQASGDDCVSDDLDGDGIKNAKDQCPTVAEDRDGFEDADGCPDDNDRDGVADAQDRCPQVAEDLNFFEDGDGCPDESERLVALASGAAEEARLASERAQLEAEMRVEAEKAAALLREAANPTWARLTFYSEEPGEVVTISHPAAGACQTPCALLLPVELNSWVTVTVVDQYGEVYQKLVPAAPGDRKAVEFVRFNGGQFAVGMSMFVVGLGMSIGGIPLAISGADSGDAAPGAVLAVAGAALWIPGELLFLLAASHFSDVEKPPMQLSGAPLFDGGAAGRMSFEF